MSELSVVLRDLERGVYERTMVTNEEEQDESANGGQKCLFLWFSKVLMVCVCADRRPSVPLVPGSGEIVETDHVIRFEGVPLVTPNGDVIIRSMDFEVKSGVNVLVCGPNGCGKSSLFRVLGEVHTPSNQNETFFDIFFVAVVAVVWGQVGEASQEQVVLCSSEALHGPGDTAGPGNLP